MRGRRRAPGGLPLGALMAQVVVVVAVVLVFGAYRQQGENVRTAEEAASFQAQLNRQEAELDQRRSALDGREKSIEAGEASLTEAQGALEADRLRIEADRSALEGDQKALAEGQRALEEARKAFESAQADLEARQSGLEARLQDYEALQKAVDDALGARGRIASALRSAFLSAGVSATVDSKGGVALDAGALFADGTSTLDADGRAVLDRLLPAWYAVLQSEGVSAVSVEGYAPLGDGEASSLAERRARAVLEYLARTPALDGASRAALAAVGLSGTRSGPEGDGRVVLGFFLNNDALRAARAG